MFRRLRKKPNLFHKAFLERERPISSRRLVRTERRFLISGVGMLWLAFGGTLFYSLFFTPWFAVTTLEVNGKSVIPREELLAFLNGELFGKRFFIFPKRHLLSVSTSSIEQEWLLVYPKFDSVRAERVFPNTLRVTVHEKPILIRWCSGGPCVLVGRDGQTFADKGSDRAAYDPFTYVIVDKSAVPVHVGESLGIASSVATLETLAQELFPRTGLSLDPVLETPTRHAEELRFRTQEGWTILVRTSVPAEETIGILERLLLEVVPEEKRKELEAIDLRAPGKVFLAYKNLPEESASLDLLAGEDQKKSSEKKSDDSKKR